jgi:hypothetical protein
MRSVCLKRFWCLVMAILLVGSPPAFAHDAPGPTNKKITYSPYPAKTFPSCQSSLPAR